MVPHFRQHNKRLNFHHKKWHPMNNQSTPSTKPPGKGEVCPTHPPKPTKRNTNIPPPSCRRRVSTQGKLTKRPFFLHEAERNLSQANPRLSTKRDEDERLPIHWAVSYNHLPIVELFVSRKDFDPDVQVGIPFLQQ